MADSEKRAQLILSIKEVGATEAAAEVKKLQTTTVSLQGELGKLSRANQLQALGTEMGTLAKKTGNVGAAVEDLNKKLVALGANKDEIEGVAGAFANAQNASDGGNGPGGNLLQRAGSSLRSLPSVQIPGLGGVGTDAIANITRLTGALGEAAGVTGVMTAATTALTPTLGATAAGITVMSVAAGGAVAIIGVLAIAIKSFSDSTSQQVETINAFADAQRSLSDKIAAGLTSKDADKEAESIQQRRDREAETLAKLQASYDEFEKQARDAAEAQKPLIQGLFGLRAGTEGLANVAKVASADEQALADQIKTSQDLIKGYDASTQTLTQAQEDGTLAANDAATAEKKLAEERTKAVLDSAEAAGKELAAEQKALAATEEQNNKRLEAIDNEKAVVQTQIDVLTASGDTSEEVTAKIAALTGSLGALGKESQFIKDVALEASRAADAEKKAKKDAEDAAKKAEQAQIAYTKAVASANLSYKNAVQDLGTRLGQTLSDNTLKFNRDLDNLGTKFRQDQFDLEVKSNRAERDAQQDQLNDLAQMRKDANKEEAQALQDGDFKALFLAREKNKETLVQEQATIDQSKAKRDQSYRDAQEDLLRSAQRQRAARQLGYEQQTTDIRTSSARDLQQAALTRQRALQIASEGQNAELAMRANFWNAALAQTANAQQQMLKIMQGGAQARGPNQSTSPYAGGFASSFTTAVRK